MSPPQAGGEKQKDSIPREARIKTMKRYRLKDLQDATEGHFLQGILPGDYLCMGGLGFKKAGERTHSHDGPGGSDRHVHADDLEAFVLLQGKAVMELDGEKIPMRVGDIFVVEPGEDHHLVSDPADPCVNLWLHAGPQPHPNQKKSTPS
jgi:mannose-6-phosphate isomerase-like protein (cupin superfamily)